MNISEFQNILRENPDSLIQFVLPDRTTIPENYHVTEVGRVEKEFIDCGGTRRSNVTCLLQTWVAEDKDHRLNSSKLDRILQLAEPVLRSTELPVEIEYEGAFISQFPVIRFEKTQSGLFFQLGTKHTDCLAREKCKVDLSVVSEKETCCGPSCC
jgi:hypothetical protein